MGGGGQRVTKKPASAKDHLTHTGCGARFTLTSLRTGSRAALPFSTSQAEAAAAVTAVTAVTAGVPAGESQSLNMGLPDSSTTAGEGSHREDSNFCELVLS